MGYSFQYKNYAEALYHALKQDAFYYSMERAAKYTKSSKQAMLKYLDYSMVEARSYGRLYIPSDHEYGVSIWSKPLDKTLEAKKTKEKKEFILRHMGERCLKKYKDIVDSMAGKTLALTGSGLWYLSIVGILPEFQNKGLGPGLVNNVLKETDAKEIATYLETFSPRNISFYERLGYRVIDSFAEPAAGSKYWLMTRQPSHV